MLLNKSIFVPAVQSRDWLWQTVTDYHSSCTQKHPKFIGDIIRPQRLIWYSADTVKMRVCFLLVAVFALVVAAQDDQPGPHDDKPSPSPSPPPIKECQGCEKGPASVCDVCITTYQPYSSIIPQQTHAWIQTEVYCTGKASQTATCTAPGSAPTQRWRDKGGQLNMGRTFLFSLLLFLRLSYMCGNSALVWVFPLKDTEVFPIPEHKCEGFLMFLSIWFIYPNMWFWKPAIVEEQK
jgi:hypothetical protein